ncbi:uncharacterized protein LOC112468333 [Temnothorax curvispinosus]|uniref:Uncharacterized protein LOC112468333 n=1 Tax=Temnothorax curvispinosus TaxID=300111 RepID=A0A6J1REN2_9HYME|nr:uncharacterized protein LOC112468333 [Temnothorax curvispinosus]
MSDNNWSNWYTYYLNCQFECAQIIAQQCANAHKQKLAHVAEYVFLKKKRSYSRKRFWVSPICSQREKHGFFKAILPSLQLEHLGFYNYFRMFSTKMEELLTLVGEDLKKQNCIRKPIPPAQRLALTLRFLASGDSMTSMHYQYLVGVTTASNIINTTCAVLWKKLQPLCMPAELKKEQWFAIEKDFKEKWNFPHCIGAIDGKHVWLYNAQIRLAQCILTTKIVTALFYWQCVMPIIYLLLLTLERTEGEVMVEFLKIRCWDKN